MGKGNVQTDQEHVRAKTCKMIIRDKCTIRLQAGKLHVTITHVLNMHRDQESYYAMLMSDK